MKYILPFMALFDARENGARISAVDVISGGMNDIKSHQSIFSLM